MLPLLFCHRKSGLEGCWPSSPLRLQTCAWRRLTRRRVFLRNPPGNAVLLTVFLAVFHLHSHDGNLAKVVFRLEPLLLFAQRGELDVRQPFERIVFVRRHQTDAVKQRESGVDELTFRCLRLVVQLENQRQAVTAVGVLLSGLGFLDLHGVNRDFVRTRLDGLARTVNGGEVDVSKVLQDVDTCFDWILFTHRFTLCLFVVLFVGLFSGVGSAAGSGFL